MNEYDDEVEDEEAVDNDDEEEVEEDLWIHGPEFDPFCKNEEGVPFDYRDCVNITSNITRNPYSIDDKFGFVDAFLQGFRYHESLASTLNCSQNLHRAIKTLEETKQLWATYEEGDWPLYLFDTTKWISYTLAPSSRYCYQSGLEVWDWINIK